MPTVLKVWRNPKKGDQLQSTLNTSNGQVDQQFIDQYSVQFSDATATPGMALTANDGTTAIPPIGAAVGDLVCVRIFPQRNPQNPAMFDVQVEFKNIPPISPSATKWNINVSVTPCDFVQDAWIDNSHQDDPNGTGLTGVPIVNSAGQTFNPTLKKTFSDDDIKIDFDSLTVDIASIDACKNHYNSSDITMTVNGLTRMFKKGTLLFKAPGYSTIVTGSPPYDWHCSYFFRNRPDGWVSMVPDRGYFKVESVGGGNKYTLFTDSVGQPHGEPILMNGQGDILPPVANGGLQTPHLLKFDMYGPADFSGLLAGIT